MDVPPPPVVNGRGDFVMCATHKTRRKVGFCEQTPIYNADRKVIDYMYTCRPDQRCTVTYGQQHGSTSGAAEDNAEAVYDCSSTHMLGGSGQQDKERGRHGGGTSQSTAEDSSTTLFSVSFAKTATTEEGSGGEDGGEVAGANNAVTAPTGEGEANPSVTAAATRGRLRYYDIQRGSGGGIGGSGAPRKVCWHCGLSGHEKPDCPNILCRTCHGKRSASFTQYHSCGPPVPSPFIILSKQLPTDTPDGMNGVRCVFCGGSGHFDCGGGLQVAGPGKSGGCSATSAVAFSSSSCGVGKSAAAMASSSSVAPPKKSCDLSCCYCGEVGHTGYDCRIRPPDRWVERMLHSGDIGNYNVAAGRGGSYAQPHSQRSYNGGYDQRGYQDSRQGPGNYYENNPHRRGGGGSSGNNSGGYSHRGGEPTRRGGDGRYEDDRDESYRHHQHHNSRLRDDDSHHRRDSRRRDRNDDYGGDGENRDEYFGGRGGQQPKRYRAEQYNDSISGNNSGRRRGDDYRDNGDRVGGSSSSYAGGRPGASSGGGSRQYRAPLSPSHGSSGYTQLRDSRDAGARGQGQGYDRSSFRGRAGDDRRVTSQGRGPGGGGSSSSIQGTRRVGRGHQRPTYSDEDDLY